MSCAWSCQSITFNNGVIEIIVEITKVETATKWTHGNKMMMKIFVPARHVFSNLPQCVSIMWVNVKVKNQPKKSWNTYTQIFDIELTLAS